MPANGTRTVFRCRSRDMLQTNSQRPQFSSASRFTAGAFGFLNIQLISWAGNDSIQPDREAQRIVSQLFRRRIFIDACLIKAAVDKKKRVPGDQPIAWPKAEEASRALAQLRERKGGPCVSTVSIVCDPTGHLQGWARAGRQLSSQPGYAGTSGLLLRVGTGSTIADAADGADGVFGK